MVDKDLKYVLMLAFVCWAIVNILHVISWTIEEINRHRLKKDYRLRKEFIEKIENSGRNLN